MKVLGKISMALVVALSPSLGRAADPRIIVPPLPPGTYKDLDETFVLIGGVGIGWRPHGGNGVQCVNNYTCSSPSGTILPPNSYKFCVATVLSTNMSDSVTFVGTANPDGTLSYGAAASGTNKSLKVHLRLTYIQVSYMGGLTGCILGPAWACGPGTAGGTYHCRSFKSPVVIKRPHS